MYNNLLSIIERISYAYNVEYAKSVDINPLNASLLDIEFTSSEINILVADTIELLKSFEVVVPVETGSVSSLVRVLAQYFSYSARGAELKSITKPCFVYCREGGGEKVKKISSESLSFFELFEFSSIAYASLEKAAEASKEIKGSCEENCATVFFQKLKDSSGFSSLDRYFSTASVTSQNEFFSLVSENIFDSKEELTESKLFSSYVLFYFVESVMLRYDLDRSGVLDKRELVQASKIFEGLVIQLLEVENSSTDKASIDQAFHFVLTMPLDAGIGRKLRFVFSPPPLRADPLSLVRVLSTILSKGK